MAFDIGAAEFGATLPEEASGESGGFSFGPPGESFSEPLPDLPPNISGRSRHWLVLAQLYLDSGPYGFAAANITGGTLIYEGRVLDWGYIDRSIPVPTGLPQIGDCRIRFADTDRRLRDILSVETPRRRFIVLKRVPEGDSESAYDPIGVFEIVTFEFSAGDATLIGRDPHFAWLPKRLPNLINRTNFPDLIAGSDEAQMPVIFGDMLSAAANMQGAVPLPRITDTRWGLAAHPVGEVVAVYKKETTDGLFSLVSGGDYTVTPDPPVIIDGIEYNLTFIDFTAPQPDGMLVQADVKGVNFRGAFAGLPPVTAPTGEALTNHLDILIALLFVFLKTETEIPPVNGDSFALVREQFEAMPLTLSGVSGTSSGTFAYKAAGAIVEPITAQEVISRWMTSTECDFYVNKFGELEVRLTLATDPDRPVFTDRQRIGLNSVKQRLASPTFNRFRYQFDRNYCTNQWGMTEVLDNVDDQEALGKIEEDHVENWFTRDPLTALDVINRRRAYVSLGSFRIDLDLPSIEVRNDIELARLFGVTHYGGLQVGGYVNAEFKTTGITENIAKAVTTLRGVLRVPRPIRPPGIESASYGIFCPDPTVPNEKVFSLTVEFP